jgi:hypothetical protein
MAEKLGNTQMHLVSERLRPPRNIFADWNRRPPFERARFVGGAQQRVMWCTA